MELTEKIILKNGEFFSQSLDIKITASDIVDKIDAFDWLDLCESESAERISEIMLNVFNRFNFRFKKRHEQIIKQAFIHLFAEAIEQIKFGIEKVANSYNVPQGGAPFRNEVVDKFYYIEYWANKKNIPVNYNEKDYNKRKLFNFDTILLNILSDKLATFNWWEKNKPEGK